MQENNSQTKKSSKEMWLFLIFLDIAALCVFAYFIYNSFGGEIQKQLTSLSAKQQADAPSKTFVEEIIVEDKQPKAKTAPVKEITPAKVNENITKEIKAEIKPQEKAPEVKEPINIAQEPKEEKKQSVFVSGTGKTRKVVFKYYGDAKKVAIVSGFTNRKPVNLTKKDGVWETSLVLYPGDYKYMYIVDNVETLDPNAPSANGRSVLTVR